MTDDTSVVRKPSKPEAPKEFPVISDWNLSLMPTEHIAQYLTIIVEASMSALPPSDREDPVLRANVTGAITDGRIQVWAILGFVPKENKWRPVGYMTTSMRFDEITGKNTLLIYTMYSWAVIDDKAYAKFDAALTAYATEQKCAKIACYTNVQRVVQMVERLGWEVSYRFAFKNLEQPNG